MFPVSPRFHLGSTSESSYKYDVRDASSRYGFATCPPMAVVSALAGVRLLPFASSPETIARKQGLISAQRIGTEKSTFVTAPADAINRACAFVEAHGVGYEVLGSLGHGGGGKVFKVRNFTTGSIEAMKVLGLPSFMSVAALERVRREIALQASIEHPHIVRLNRARVTGSFALLFMDLIDGPSLARRLKFGRLPVRQSMNYIAQTASALGHLHDHGIIHRDIKPSNIVTASNGVAKLLDFGIARPFDSQLTESGQVIGSLQYMSPEQIALGGTVDARSDIYSAGVTLYELLTGVRPFDSFTAPGVIAAHLRGEPIPVSEINPEIEPGLNGVVMQAISRRPCDRFQSAVEFRDAIESVTAQSRDSDSAG